MKNSVNKPCPCGSKVKYKHCCQKYHKGASAVSALLLMKSRYSAYVLGDAKYIMKTTHHDNADYHDDKAVWKKEIEAFSKETVFQGLVIEDFSENTVTFQAHTQDGILHEKSTFSKINGHWLYLKGKIL